MSMKAIAGTWRRSFFSAGGGFSRSLTSALLFILFLGIFAGGGVGIFSSAGNPGTDIAAYAREQLPSGFAECLHGASRFFLLAALFSTSYLGVVLLPSLVFVRGFVFSRALSAFFAAYSFRGLLSALLISGIPALISIPCFLIVCCGCFESSRCLFMQRFHALPPIKSLGGLFFLLSALFSIAFECAYTCLFLPGLLERFF